MIKQNLKKAQKILFKFVYGLITMAVIFNFTAISPDASQNQVPTAQAAAANLIMGGSFEQGINDYWGTFINPASTRTYNLYRSYDVPFGYGSYSAIIEAEGARTDSFNAFLIGNESKNSFAVSASKEYFLTFYAKGDREYNILTLLEDATSYAVVAPAQGIQITTAWKKYNFFVKPTADTKALLAFALGEMPNGASLNIDGISLAPYSPTLTTAEIKGYANEKKKCLTYNDLSAFSMADVEIKLPFFDAASGNATTKSYRPDEMTAKSICFSMYPNTFSGVGSVLISGRDAGIFTYTILPKLTDYYPTLLRADEDVSISGSGFSPIDDNTFVVLQAINNEGKKYEYWTKPSFMDSTLSEMAVHAPLGIISGNLYVQTSYVDAKGETKINKSTSLSYKVKPVISKYEWSQQGFDQVGDKLRVFGKGISNNPTVNFYDSNNQSIAKVKAVRIGTIENEIIEVATPKNLNQLNITVTVDGVESNQAGALIYTAKARLIKITSSAFRNLFESEEKIQAAKIGEEITLSGEGFYYPDRQTTVEFQGQNSRIRVDVPAEAVDVKGKTIKVQVPATAQTGYIDVEVNGQKSNYMPIEIIPTVLSVQPNPIVPGSEITITANGVGDTAGLATVYFTLPDGTEKAVQPSSLALAADGTAVIRANAPLALASNGTIINLQYNRWRDDSKTALTIAPHVTEVSMDMDSKILVIKGFGFSITPKENVITYKYADDNHTVVTPAVRMLGVYPTEEGMEIRIQVQDDYHYGYVSVSVGGQTSNEVNFGPMAIRKIVRRVEYVKSLGATMGVLYISGNNFGPTGGVRVGTTWATVHYRSDFFIIAVIDPAHLYENPVIVAKE